MQAIGATTPFFTAVMAVCVNRTSESAMTYVALVPVVAGQPSNTSARKFLIAYLHKSEHENAKKALLQSVQKIHDISKPQNPLASCYNPCLLQDGKAEWHCRRCDCNRW